MGAGHLQEQEDPDVQARLSGALQEVTRLRSQLAASARSQTDLQSRLEEGTQQRANQHSLLDGAHTALHRTQAEAAQVPLSIPGCATH